MVLQVKDYGAFRHQSSTAWFVTYSLRAPQTPKEKSQEKQSEHPQAKHVSRIAKTRRSGVVNIRYTRESHGASSQRLRCFQAPTEHCMVRDLPTACAPSTRWTGTEKQSEHPQQAKLVRWIAKTRRSGVVNIRYIRESHGASSQRLRRWQAPT